MQQLLTEKLVITGPTGVGKTAYVNALLCAHPLEIVNMDSCQVYSFFRVGTGRGDGEELACRHLYGFLSPFEELTVDAYVDKATAVVHEIELHGKSPLFEGGSRSLLPALARAMPLKVFGLRPPDDPAWIEEKMARRVEGFLAGDLILREVEAGLRLGYGDTRLMRDPMIYMQTRDFLNGRLSPRQLRRQMVRSMKAMHDDQLEKFAAMDLEIHWLDTATEGPDELRRQVEAWMVSHRG